MNFSLKKSLLLSVLCVKFFSFEASASGVTFDQDNFSNGEIVARLGIPNDSHTSVFAMLESMKTALAEIKTSTRGSDSGVESSALEQVKGLVAAKASSVDVEALRTSVEGELDRLAQQLTSVDQRFLAMEAQIRTTSLENIIDDCFPNDLIENKSLSVVFAGDASFVLKDGDGEFTIQGGMIPYGLFAIDALGQKKQVEVLIAKPEDKALRVLRVLVGLSQTWIDANITEVDDLGTIVPSVFDYCWEQDAMARAPLKAQL